MPLRRKRQYTTDSSVYRTGFRCVYCNCVLILPNAPVSIDEFYVDGRLRDGLGILNYDHVVARARGGSNEKSNIAHACHVCNKYKKDKDVDVFLQSDWLAKRIAHIKSLA